MPNRWKFRNHGVRVGNGEVALCESFDAAARLAAREARGRLEVPVVVKRDHEAAPWRPVPESLWRAFVGGEQ